MFEHYTLNNGSRVVLVPKADTRAVTVLLMYPVGSRYEPAKLSGVSHYIEHLMFKGTERRKNTLTLTREIDRLGAEYNAFTSKEYTGYYIKIDSDYTETAIDILSDMLFHSTFDPKEMEREKGPIVEELRMYKDNPIMNLDNVFEELLYAGCPLGRDIGGTPDHVLGFTRDEVLAYKARYYQPANLTMVVAGNLPGNIRAWIDTYVGREAAGQKPHRAFSAALFGSKEKKHRLVVHPKKTDQAQVMLGFPGFAYHAKENPAIGVMNTILGGSMSARLFIQVRERRGLAYSISSGDEQFRDTGHVFVRMGVDPSKINNALSVVLSEIEKLVSKGITERELKDAKTHLHGSLALSMEDSSALANWYAKEALFYPEIKTPQERLRELDAVQREDIHRVAKKVFTLSQMRLAVIGDIVKENIRF